MREILFRAKNKNLGWVEGFYTEGYYLDGTPVSWIEIVDRRKKETESITVDPQTVGQYTGLTDKNGRNIFEGDILEFEDVGETGYEYKEGFDFTNRAAVVWEHGRWCMDKFLETNSGVVDDMNGHFHDDFILVFGGGKVIGNIHDNPELLEVK